MKRTITIAAVLLMAMAACKKPHHPPTASQSFIPIDSANKMVNSYLNSISFPGSDTNVRCFSIKASDLRLLLDSLPQSPAIKEVQVKFGHTLEYINSGHANQFAGYQKNALTLLVVGVDVAGNYVYASGKVLDHSHPCPNNCPNGTAANPYYMQ